MTNRAKNARKRPFKTQVNNEETTAQVSGAAPERFIALTFDDRHLVTSDVAPLTKAADGFIDSIGPADRVGIFTTSGLLTQDFTSDKELLKQEVLKVMSRTLMTIKGESQPELSIPQLPAVKGESQPRMAPLPASLINSSNAVKEEGDEEIRIEFEEIGITLRLLGSKPGSESCCWHRRDSSCQYHCGTYSFCL
jgi:hypothetical protein